MNIFHKTQKKETRKLPMTGKVKKGFRYYCAAVLSVTAVFAMSTTAFAASDPLTVVNNLSDFIFGFIRAIGLILLGFGIGFLTLAGGVIITFAKEILTLITG